MNSQFHSVPSKWDSTHYLSWCQVYIIIYFSVWTGQVMPVVAICLGLFFLIILLEIGPFCTLHIGFVFPMGLFYDRVRNVVHYKTCMVHNCSITVPRVCCRRHIRWHGSSTRSHPSANRLNITCSRGKRLKCNSLNSSTR